MREKSSAAAIARGSILKSESVCTAASTWSSSGSPEARAPADVEGLHVYSGALHELMLGKGRRARELGGRARDHGFCRDGSVKVT